ncbi:MAG: alanine racemase [Burkholderiaceae bacterium]
MTTIRQPLTSLDTPCLLLDRERLQKNADAMLERSTQLQVKLRPHLKTSKSEAVARIAKAENKSGITVSTLKEAEYFAGLGYRDILLAVGITPNKFDRVAALSKQMGEPLLLVTDDADIAQKIADYALFNKVLMSVMIEIDCGEHRSGLPSEDSTIVDIGRILSECAMTSCAGVMTHAGHSYSTADPAQIARISRDECSAAVAAANRLRAAGVSCEIVSVGSTPTVVFAEQYPGVTEVRCGIYLFWDLAQLSRNICTIDDVALTVLTSVIGHNKAAGTILLDAGALALSKDTGANNFLPDAGFGYVCDSQSAKRLGNLSVLGVHQEHGSVPVADETWFQRLPVGSMVRIMPNHACLTAAPYDSYYVVDGGEIVDRWQRISGW